ncbi:retron St85 family effector protein, partial [Pseudomonas aeruginosa]
MDPRPRILADVDLTESKIHFSKNPIVLLCGGHVPEKEHADAVDPSIRSLRDALKRKALALLKAPHIFRPEEITSWHEDGVFRNLMDFEADLASICSLVAIAVESEGSIAELGAFSQLPDFQKKLIVFVPEEYAGAKSFIFHRKVKTTGFQPVSFSATMRGWRASAWITDTAVIRST